MSTKITKILWQYCPECGSTDYREPEEKGHRQCNRCRQEWFTDVDYTDGVRANLKEFSILKNRMYVFDYDEKHK